MSRAKLFVLLACVLTARLARAQSADAVDATTEEARVLYVEGRDLRRQGDLERSLEKFQAAYALHPTPITALEVGRARGLVGRLREAIEVLRSVERLPVKASESDKAAAARLECKDLASQYAARVPKLLLRVDDVGARVWVDGESVSGASVHEPWIVNPGLHHVEAANAQGTAGEDVRVVEGEERVVNLSLSSPATRPAPPPTGREAAASAAVLPASGPSLAGILAYAGFGVAAAGVVTGTITGILTLERAADLKRTCTGGLCPSAAGLDSTQTLGNVSTVAFLVGGTGAAIGVVALLIGGRPRTRTGAWVRPLLAVGSGGVEGGF